MNRILLVSHSLELAQATKNFCENMLPNNLSLKIEIVAGNDNGEFGNSFTKIKKELEKKQFKNTYIIYDLGSAKMILDLVLEKVANNSNHLINCSFLEGAFIGYSLINDNSNPSDFIKSIEGQAKLKF